MILRVAVAAWLGAAFLAAQTPGTLLVASPALRDEGFARTVILIIENDGQAALGLVLNRPLGDGRFAGGPVASGLRSLVRAGVAPKDARRLCDDVYLVNRTLPAARVYAGYTGWTPAQLREEVRRGLWSARAATSAVVFDSEPATMWKRLQSPAAH